MELFPTYSPQGIGIQSFQIYWAVDLLGVTTWWNKVILKWNSFWAYEIKISSMWAVQSVIQILLNIAISHEKEHCDDKTRQWTTYAMKIEVNGCQFLENLEMFKWAELAMCPGLYWQRNAVSFSVTCDGSSGPLEVLPEERRKGTK